MPSGGLLTSSGKSVGVAAGPSTTEGAMLFVWVARERYRMRYCSP